MAGPSQNRRKVPLENHLNYTFSTCFGAGPDGIFIIFDVTSTTLLLTGKSEAEFPFSGQR